MKAKQYIITFLLWACLSTSMSAQNITALFISMPDDIMPTLRTIQKTELTELYKDNKAAIIKDNFGTPVYIREMTDEYIRIQSDSTSFEMMLLSLVNDSKIICTTYTACAPVCDSRIRFYTTDWKALDTNSFINIADASWFIKGDTDLSNEQFLIAQSSLDMDLMEFKLNPEEQTLTQIYNTPSYLNKNDYQKVQPYLKGEPKVYRWNKLQFK